MSVSCHSFVNKLLPHFLLMGFLSNNFWNLLDMKCSNKNWLWLRMNKNVIFHSQVKNGCGSLTLTPVEWILDCDSCSWQHRSQRTWERMKGWCRACVRCFSASASITTTIHWKTTPSRRQLTHLYIIVSNIQILLWDQSQTAVVLLALNPNSHAVALQHVCTNIGLL